MAATFEWAIRNGAPAGTITTLGASGNLSNFQSADTAIAANYVTNTIVAGTNSFELWWLGHFIGTFNRIDGLRFWMSTNFSPSTGLSVFWKTNGQIAYLQPAAGTSSIATDSIPMSNPGATNVAFGGNLSGSLVAHGYTDHIVLQLRTTTAATPGDTSLATFSLTYNEN